MTPRVRVIRFARVEPTPSSASAESVVVGRVLLDEQAAPSGHIVLRTRMWAYILTDGSPSGLTSIESRQDLERQVVLYHLGTVASDDSGDAIVGSRPPPFKLAM